MTTLRDIANLSGVSTATVSRALNSHPQVTEKTRAKVLRAAQSLGYSAAPAETHTDIQRIAVVYPGPVWIGMHSPFDAALLRGLSQCMAENDFEITLVDLRRRLRADESYASWFRRRGISAAVLRSDDSTLHICERIAADGVPCVMLGERPATHDVSYVSGASKGGAREAVEHLISLGHTRIPICVNNVITTDHRDRIEGWREALAAHGLEAPESDLIQMPAALSNGVVLLRKLMSMTPRPTAVFVTDPMLAVGLINDATLAGVRVPEDLSVVGFDDDDARMMTVPKMSSVCQDAAALGRTAVKLLRQMIDGAIQTPAQVRMDAWFEARESTSPPGEPRREIKTGLAENPAAFANQGTPARPLPGESDS